MPLIIEDGSIVANATNFTTDGEFVAYALARSLTIPATEAARDVLQIKAIDYLNSKEVKLQGYRVSIDQDLPYPRKGACVRGFYLPSTGLKSIPNDIKKACMELSAQAAEDELLTNEINKNVESEKLGSLEVSYFSGGSLANVRTGRADAYLKPFYINGGSTNQMMRV